MANLRAAWLLKCDIQWAGTPIQELSCWFPSLAPSKEIEPSPSQVSASGCIYKVRASALIWFLFSRSAALIKHECCVILGSNQAHNIEDSPHA